MKIFSLLILLFISSEIFGQCPPQFTLTIPSLTPTCLNPVIQITATASSSNVSFVWVGTDIFPSATGNTINLPDINVGWPPENIPTCYAYTLTATNTLLSCSSSSVFTLCPNIKFPISSPSIIGSNSVICKNNNVLLSSINSSITSGIIGASITNTYWQGPGLEPLLTPTLSVSNPGIYTLQVQDSYNGCKRTGTIQVTDSRPQFNLQGMAPTTSVSCNGSVTINTQILNGYSLSTSSGSLNGTTISNLCYGWVKVCMTNINSQCFKCDSLLINAATSIDENDWEQEILIFPNPSSGNVNITYPSKEKTKIKIFDLEGRMILVDPNINTGASLPETEALEVSATNISSSKLEIKDLKAGVYMVELNIDGSILRKKIIVLKP